MNLSDPVDKAPLVGTRYKSLLKRLDIETIEDIVHHYPFRYEDLTKIKKINELFFSEEATIKGEVKSIENIITRNRKRLTKAVVADDTGSLEVVWFNQPYIIKNIHKGDIVNLSGKLASFSNKPAIISPEYEVENNTPSIHTGRIVPIYPETEGVSSKWLRAVISRILSQPVIEEIDDYLPQEIKQRYKLIDLITALKHVHFPQNHNILEAARRRLAFDELFLLQLKAFIKRRDWKNKGKAPDLQVKDWDEEYNKFLSNLPFELTNAQQRSVKELLEDLKIDKPMNRLLEGDVGSGKTVVATMGMYLANLCGYQSILMAPTEALAQQHYQTINTLLKPYNIKIDIHTGSEKTVKQKESPSVIIGTHALLYDSIKFDNVGLVIIDEQHRFGVQQRAKLIKKAEKNLVPHLLTMTATPIPRTMALTLYGDLDLSLIDEMPPGRKKVKTYVVPHEKRKAGEEWVKKQIVKEQAQVFVICPLIEESENLQTKAATEEYKRLKTEVFPDLNVGLLHGQLPNKEKTSVLEEFRQKRLDILVSTSVVEVGIDIPSATIMIIEGAERFGLAALHQLRGRVGRGEKESYCFLFTQSRSTRAYGRLKSLEKIHNGLKLAEIDLKMRGPGDIYGLKQHGLINLKIADLTNIDQIQQARTAARDIIKTDDALEKYPKLHDKIKAAGEIAPN